LLQRGGVGGSVTELLQPKGGLYFLDVLERIPIFLIFVLARRSLKSDAP
jgi:hypothetical protein